MTIKSASILALSLLTANAAFALPEVGDRLELPVAQATCEVGFETIMGRTDTLTITGDFQGIQKFSDFGHKLCDKVNPKLNGLTILHGQIRHRSDYLDVERINVTVDLHIAELDLNLRGDGHRPLP